MKSYLYKALFFIGNLLLLLIIIGIVFPYNLDGYIRAQKFKMDKLAEANRKPTIVILGGSNAAFGYDTKELNDSLSMPVFNAGLHAGMGMKFFLDDCSQYLKEGDILVFSPEYAQFYGNINDGQSEMTDVFYLYHCCYPGEISFKQILGIIQNTPAYLRRKIEYNLFALAHLKTDPVYALSSFNEYGDVTWHWYNNRAHGKPDGRGMDGDNLAFNENAFKYLVTKLEILKEKGITILLYPAAFQKEAFDNSLKSVQYISDRLSDAGFAYVSNPEECTFSTEYFYDTNYHLNHDGALLHNKHLINVLKEILKSESNQ